MPLFRRTDGDPLRGLSPVRRIVPFLQPTRNESIVYHESTFPVGAAREWLHAWNAAHPGRRATLFHLLAFGCARALHERPELNRFASGGLLYQRRGVQLAFVAKRELSDRGEMATVKIEVPASEPFAAFVDRITAAIEGARGAPRAIDKEVALFLHVPPTLLRAAVRLVVALDRWNLLPGWFTRDDPMFCSLFLANLGSAGISDAYHHLYEYGTCSLFGAMSAARKAPVVEGDAVVVREILQVRWSFDERIHDAFYAARSLALVERLMAAPAEHLGSPSGPGAAAPA